MKENEVKLPTWVGIGGSVPFPLSLGFKLSLMYGVTHDWESHVPFWPIHDSYQTNSQKKNDENKLFAPAPLFG